MLPGSLADVMSFGLLGSLIAPFRSAMLTSVGFALAMGSFAGAVFLISSAFFVESVSAFFSAAARGLASASSEEDAAASCMLVDCIAEGGSTAEAICGLGVMTSAMQSAAARPFSAIVWGMRSVGIFIAAGTAER